MVVRDCYPDPSFRVTFAGIAVSITLLIMGSSVLNFLAGVLVFAAACVPAIRGLWRMASKHGRRRTFLSLAATLIALCCLLAGQLGMAFMGLPVGWGLLLFVLYGVLVMISFMVEDIPMTRMEIAGFVTQMSLAVIMVAFAATSADLKRLAARVDERFDKASPSPSASPSPVAR